MLQEVATRQEVRSVSCDGLLTASHLDVKAHEVVLAVAGDLVLHGGVALRHRLQLVEEICHHLRSSMVLSRPLQSRSSPAGQLAVAVPLESDSCLALPPAFGRHPDMGSAECGRA